MKTIYPNISIEARKFTVKLSSEEVYRRAEINLALDVDSKINQIVGIEIIDFKEKTSSKVTQLEELDFFTNGIHWKVTYDPEIDAAYFGFQSGNGASLKTQQANGTVLFDSLENVLGIEIKL